MKYRVLFLTFLLVVCFCSCGPQKLTRDLATQLIKESETFQKKQGNVKFHKTGFDKMKKHEMLEMIIVGEGFFKKREIQVKNEYQNIFSLGYIKSYTSPNKYIIMLNNPVPIKLTEVTGITDAATGKGVKETQFTWEYSELPSLVRRFVIKGGKGTAYMRLYDDGWRIDEIKLETTDEPIQLTKKEIEQEKKELKETADRIAAEKELKRKDAEEAARIKAEEKEKKRVLRAKKQEAERAFKAAHYAYKRGIYATAVAEYERSWQLGNLDALNQLAWHFATCKDVKQHNGKRAVELALKLTMLEQKGQYLDTLAAAYARNGQFKEAISTQVRALSLGRLYGGEKRLKLYRKGLPYQEAD